MNHVFIGVPKNDTGMDTPRSVIFGTRKADEDNFRLINITCQNNHLTFENVAQTPEMRWSADISGEDIGKEYDFSLGLMVDATKVEDFISNKESSKLKCPELVTDGKSYKSTSTPQKNQTLTVFFCCSWFRKKVATLKGVVYSKAKHYLLFACN